ncbi:MAG: hypothetical protein HY905_13975 [Deltaproteobacteria bacterium]|nr:hypothetical protein [Deltaproteobacteria bacterium]
MRGWWGGLAAAVALAPACGGSAPGDDATDVRETAEVGDDDGGTGGDADAPGDEGPDGGLDGDSDGVGDDGEDAEVGGDGDADDGGDGGDGDSDDGGGTDGDAAEVAGRIFGGTVTDPWAAEAPGGALGTALDGLVGAGGRRPTARVVFDEGIDRIFRSGGLDASVYVPLVGSIASHAVVMGELLDSLYVGDYDLDQYRLRACEYRATLGHLVDSWEIGNEVNGEWLGSGVLEKLAAAADVFAADAAGFAAACPGFALRPDEKAFGLALTFYYNGPYDGGVPTADNCWSDASHAMERWVDDGFAAPGALGTERIAPVLDLVLVSYYEDDCEGLQPEWGPVFDHLGEVFPGAALGFGECGTQVAGSKVAYVRRYYQGMDLPDAEFANMHVDHPRFVGGFFWWYFSDDLADADVYGGFVEALSGPFWGGGP